MPYLIFLLPSSFSSLPPIPFAAFCFFLSSSHTTPLSSPPYRRPVRYIHDPEQNFHEILVPTADTERCQWLLKLMLSIAKPVVLIGETGTSKTATIQQFLRKLDADSTVGKAGKCMR